MSALDQALIKVYTQQPPPTAAAPHEGLRAVPLAEALADPPKAQDQRPPLTPDTVMDVLAQPAPKLPEVPPATSDIALPPGSNELTEPQPPVPHFVKPKPAKSRKSSKAAPTLEDLQMPDLIYRVDTAAGAGQDALGTDGMAPSPHLHMASSGTAAMGGGPAGTLTADTATAAPASAPIGPSESRGPKPPAEKPAVAGQSSVATCPPSTPGADASGGGASAAQATAAPALMSASAPVAAGKESPVPAPHYAAQQLSTAPVTMPASSGASAGFTLPETCTRLLTAASEQVDRLCDALSAARLQGRQIIAFAAYRRHEGTTTVLLCAAQRLAERGLRIAIVEADPTAGRLAKTLAVEPGYGWDAVLAGQASLETVLLRSPCKRLSLLPWSGEQAAVLDGLPDSSMVCDHLTKLAAEHHIVLLDGASLEAQGTTGGFLVRCVGKRLDGLVLVHNPNFTSRERIAEVQRRLAAAGVFHIGVVQNLARKR